MVTITYKDLMRLANERRLNPDFERTWEKHNGTNPVAEILSLESEMRSHLRKVFVALLLMTLSGWVLSWVISEKVLLSQLISAVIFAFVAAYHASRWWMIRTLQKKWSSKFLDCLQVLVTEIDMYWRRSPDKRLGPELPGVQSLMYENINHTKKYVDGLLRGLVACLVHRELEASEAEGGDVKESFLQQAAVYRLEIRRLFDTFKQVGLVSNLGSYFEALK